MYYDRKIKYLDYIENGQRLRNGGFVKFEVRDDKCCITLQVSGLRTMEPSSCKVYFLSGKRQEIFCEIPLQQGKGSVQLCTTRQNLCGGIDYEQLEAIQIPIYTGRELRCIIAEKRRESEAVARAEDIRVKAEDSKEVQRKMETEVQRETGTEVQRETGTEVQRETGTEVQRETGTEVQRETETEVQRKMGTEVQRETETEVQWETGTEVQRKMGTEVQWETGAEGSETVQQKTKASEEIQQKAESEEPRNMQPKCQTEELQKVSQETEHAVQKKTEQPMQRPLLEDKWKQLSAIYPHISPFQDEREYLSVGPGDFVILSQKYYKLVNNSFLLHGFYNYKHLILTCMEAKGEKRYYIGVPGNFYEREKQVAIMFGFESFECREEPAKMGDFGYYMIRVEI